MMHALNPRPTAAGSSPLREAKSMKLRNMGGAMSQKKSGGAFDEENPNKLNRILYLVRHPTIVTKLGLRSPHYLVRVRKWDEWKTAFHTTRGHYEYRVMSFGFQNAPSVFQAFINDVHQDMLGQFLLPT